MANEIDLVVGSEAFAQITKLLVELGKVDASFTELSAKFAALGSNTNTVKSTADLAKLSAENAKLNAVIEEQIKDFADLNAKLTQVNTARAASSKYITQETTDLRLVNKELTLQNTKASELAGAYEKLSAAHKIARESAANLGVIQGTNSKAFLEAAAAANTYDKKLKEIDQQLGNHGRHVGDYSRTWNGLGNSINQITREAPAFANSLSTGFMALSNNIPILFDELDNLKRKNQELAATGKPTESMFKTVAEAFFSWQTAISLGVTIITIYGAKLWELVTAGDAASKAQKQLAEANDEAAKNASKEIGELDVLYRTSQNHALSIEQRKKAVDKMQEVYPSYFANLTDEEILNGKAEKSYYALRDGILASARAKAISSKLDENAATRFDEEYEILDKLEKAHLSVAKALAFKGKEQKTVYAGMQGSAAISITQTKEQMVAMAKQHEKQTANELRLFRLKGQNEDSLLIKQLAIDDKLAAKRNFDATKLKTEKVAKPKEDKSAEDAAKKEEERLKRQYEALKSNLDKQKEIDKDSLDSFSGTLQEKQILAGKLYADEVAIANAVYDEKVRLAKGDVSLITVAENEKTKAIGDAQQENIKKVQGYYEAKEKEDADALKIQLEEQKRQGALLKELEDIVDKDEKDRLKKKADYLKSFADDFASNSGLTETFKMMSGQIEGFGEDTAVTFNAVAEASQEMFNKIAEYSMANYEQEYARLEAQKETSLKFAGDSAVAKEKIEKDYAAKKKEIDKKKFEDEKKISMVNIVIDTAQAVMATLKETGFFGTPLALIIGAFGAAQLAMVAAQQFPAYAEGTDNHKGGLMLVNDGAGSNYQEKVILPSGKVIRPQGRNVLMNAPKGTKVLNHEQQLFEMLQNNNISMSSQQASGLTYDEMNEIFQKNLGNIKTQNTIFDKNGFQSYVKNGNSITRSNSNRSQAIGISV